MSRSPRSRTTRIGVLVGAVALVASGTASAVLLSRSPASDALTASSTATGFSVQALEPGARDGRGWRSSDSDTAPTVTMRLPRAREVNRLRISAPDEGSLLRRGHLEFADGSTVAFVAASSARAVVVDFPVRTTTAVTMVADELGRSARHVQYTALSVGWSAASSVGPDGPPDSVTASSNASALGGGARAGDLAAWRPAEDDEDPSVELSWNAPRAVHVIEAQGQPGSAPFAGVASFSDGSTLDLGVITAARPTVTAFMSRVTTSIRLTASDGRVSLAKFSTAPLEASDPPSPSKNSGAAPTADCSAPAAGATGAEALTILCPAAGSQVVGDAFVIHARFRPGAAVTVRAWVPALRRVEQVASGSTGDDGVVALAVRTSDLLRGPLNVLVVPDRGDPVVVQVVNTAGVAPDDGSSAPRGLHEVYRDDFDAPVSVSVSGESTRYAAVKPSADGATQFGGAPFSDPGLHPQQISTIAGGQLRLQLSDVQGADGSPQQQGALISSYSSLGSGFAALDGYFEARILGGPGRGAWPAFWMLSADSAYRPGVEVSEVDAVELYGHDLSAACHATHNYLPGEDDFQKVTCLPVGGSDDDWALRWHTYATKVTANEAVFLVDGVVVARAPRTAARDQPMFFMLDLAAGGGWPVDLAPTSGVSQMYVDWVRVAV